MEKKETVKVEYMVTVEELEIYRSHLIFLKRQQADELYAGGDVAGFDRCVRAAEKMADKPYQSLAWDYLFEATYDYMERVR